MPTSTATRSAGRTRRCSRRSGTATACSRSTWRSTPRSSPTPPCCTDRTPADLSEKMQQLVDDPDLAQTYRRRGTVAGPGGVPVARGRRRLRAAVQAARRRLLRHPARRPTDGASTGRLSMCRRLGDRRRRLHRRASRRALLDRGDDVVVLDDLSGGFTDNVDARAAFVEGSVTDHELVDDLFAPEQFERRLPLRGVRGRGPEPLHQAVQLHEQRDRQRQPDQRVGEHGRRVLRLHLVDRGLRRRPDPDDRGDAARARGLLRHREVRGRARAGREPRDVRA